MVSGKLALKVQSDYNRLIITGLLIGQSINKLTGAHTLAREQVKSIERSLGWMVSDLAELGYNNSIDMELDLSAIAAIGQPKIGDSTQQLQYILNTLFSDKLMANSTLGMAREEMSVSVDSFYTGFITSLDSHIGFLQNYLTPFLNDDCYEEACEALSFSDLSIHIDEVAGKLQNAGYMKLATTVDAVANEYEKEAGAMDYLKNLGVKALKKIMTLPSMHKIVADAKIWAHTHLKDDNLDHIKQALAREVAEAISEHRGKGVSVEEVLRPKFLAGALMEMIHKGGDGLSKEASIKIFQSKLIILAAIVLGGLFLLKGVSTAHDSVEKIQNAQKAPTSLESQMAELEK